MIVLVQLLEKILFLQQRIRNLMLLKLILLNKIIVIKIYFLIVKIKKILLKKELRHQIEIIMNLKIV